MPVTFPKGEEPSVLSANPNGPKDHAGDDGKNPRKDVEKDQPSIQPVSSKGPVQSDNLPAAASKDELKARKEELNRKD